MMIRAATPADAGAIRDIWNPLIRETDVTFTSVEKSLSDVRALLEARASKGFPMLVAEESGIQGYASFDYFRGPAGYAHTVEHSVQLHPDAWGKGWGRALMSALEENARALDMHTMIGAVSAENTAGLQFHAALGFHEAGRLKAVGRKFERWIDLVLMQKML